MPKLSVWAIRAALVYLFAGFSFGMLMLANKGVLISPQLWILLRAHMEFLLVGWTAQLALGVAFWILPRLSTVPGSQGERGNEKLAWAALILLNLGVILASLGGAALLAGRVCQVLGAVLFAAHAWVRVRPLVFQKG